MNVMNVKHVSWKGAEKSVKQPSWREVEKVEKGHERTRQRSGELHLGGLLPSEIELGTH